MTAVSDSKGKPTSWNPEARRRAGRSLLSQAGKKPSISSFVTLSRSTSTDTVPPISLLPRPSTEIACLSGASAASNVSLAVRQECHSATDCHGSSWTP